MREIRGVRSRTIWSGVMLAIIFLAWAIISGVIMLGSIFSGSHRAPGPARREPRVESL